MTTTGEAEPTFDWATGFSLTDSPPISAFDRKGRAQHAPKYCEVCGERSTCISDAGMSVCDEHAYADQEAEFDWRTGRRLAQDAIPDNTLPDTTSA
jgi:hypothetical protein